MRRFFTALFALSLGACERGTGTLLPDASQTDVTAVESTADVAPAVDATIDRSAADVTTPDALADATTRDLATTDIPAADAGTPRTVLRVHYPSFTGGMALRGGSEGLSWDRGVALRDTGDGVWEWSSDSVRARLEWKPLLGDVTWSRGPNYTVHPGETADVWPHFTQGAGAWSRRWPTVRSTALGSTRGVWVYLPPTYAENPLARFPVVYMHDGQNLFDPRAAFGGTTWRIPDAMDTGAEDGTIHEAIIVGIENTAARIDELTPTMDASEMAGGRGDLYLRMVIDELKPMVDRELRTMPDRMHTAVMGSSLGGLISVYAGVRRADVFGLVGALSPSTWWDNEMIVGEVASLPTRPARPLRFYVDSGDSGPSMDDLTQTRRLAATMRTVGYVEGSTLRYVVQPGAVHNEVYWAQRVPGALAFLLGPRERLP